ncbi:Uncharacterised protein [Vibrio cholerae]|nr:Uncharacterised protein [Vibrio cholerae]CSB76051.1 Uncharacterised protein [Vibrio cholerae]CSD04327.1 Uncharacterised protein [Vibrio cholerae]
MGLGVPFSTRYTNAAESSTVERLVRPIKLKVFWRRTDLVCLHALGSTNKIRRKRRGRRNGIATISTSGQFCIIYCSGLGLTKILTNSSVAKMPHTIQSKPSRNSRSSGDKTAMSGSNATTT